MISVSSSIDRRVVLFFLSFLLSSIMAKPASALSTTNDVPTTNTGTRASTRTHRPRQPFLGQDYALWDMVITTDKLKPAVYNKLAKKTAGLVNRLCTGNFEHVLTALSSGTDYKFTEPQLTSTDQKAQIMYKIKYTEYSKHENNYQNNKIALASSLLGQCGDSVLQQLADMDDYTSGQYDILWVLSALNQLCSGIHNNEIPIVQVVTAFRKLFVTKQHEHQSIISFREEFKHNVQTLQAVGATIKLPASCLKLEEQLDPDNKLTETVKQDRAFARVMALTFLSQCGQSADQTCTLLKMQYVQWQNNYLASITVASNLLRASKPASRPNRGPRALTLTQRATNSTNSTTHRPSVERPYDVCGSPDHWAPNCPSRVRATSEAPPSNAVSFDRIISLTQNHSITLSYSLVLLDSCSMCSVFKSPHLIRNIGYYSTKGHSSGITIVSKGGSMECRQVGKLPGLSFPIWYHPNSVANIVSLAEMVCERRVTMDSDAENALVLHAHNGCLLRFEACGSGLYTHDLTNKDYVVATILALTQTVTQSESQFTKRKVKLAQAARDLQRRLAYPSQCTLEHLLKSNYYPNCPITAANVRRGVTIYGPLPEFLQGKTKCVTPASVPSTTIVNLPSYILKEHGTVTIAIDFFAVNGN